MKKKILFLIAINVIATTVLAQGYYFPGNTNPRETSFTTDSILFSELLSEFSLLCQQHDTIFESQWYNPLMAMKPAPLNSKYEKILMTVPFFMYYPAFRIDCPQGYVLGFFNQYLTRQSWISYLDILSFDLHGRLISRYSWANSGVGSFMSDDRKMFQDSQITSSTDIVNGEIHYGFTKRSFVAGEPVFVESAEYRYRILDDSTLKLLSVSSQ